MFDLAWSEIALIAVVAIIVIGPKDLPEAVRGVARGVQKLRRMAGEFQGQVDEVVREANLQEVRDQIRDIRGVGVKGALEKALDEDGSIRRTLNEDPIGNPSSWTSPAYGPTAYTPPPPDQPPGEAPAFVPPSIAPPPAAVTAAATPAAPVVPDLVPPATLPETAPRATTQA
jgi:sec-independent protein translocase protein TatB